MPILWIFTAVVLSHRISSSLTEPSTAASIRVVTCGGALEPGSCVAALPVMWDGNKKSGAAPAAGARRLSSIEDCGDGFDFYQLILIAEHGDAHQGAGTSWSPNESRTTSHAATRSSCRTEATRTLVLRTSSSDAPASARAIRMFSMAFAAWPT